MTFERSYLYFRKTVIRHLVLIGPFSMLSRRHLTGLSGIRLGTRAVNGFAYFGLGLRTQAFFLLLKVIQHRHEPI